MTEEREAEGRDVTITRTDDRWQELLDLKEKVDEEERQREESYKQFEVLGEVEVERRVQLGYWIMEPRMHGWASAWLREQSTKREIQAGVDSARAAKTSNLIAAIAIIISIAAFAWSVWGP